MRPTMLYSLPRRHTTQQPNKTFKEYIYEQPYLTVYISGIRRRPESPARLARPRIQSPPRPSHPRPVRLWDHLRNRRR
jgi:hypothetical protein